MGQLIVGLLLGALFGVAIGYAVAVVRGRAHGEAGAADRAALDAQRQRSLDLEGTLERERRDHEQAMAQLSDRFKTLASETLKGVVDEFRASQEDVFKQRESALDERLTPLDTLLRDYQERVRELEASSQKGLIDVKHSADQLLEAQGRVMDETKRLNTILGRSSQRGRWGEIQLQRILEYSDMLKYVDFDPQLTVKGHNENRQRPDVVVRLPRGASIAIDSKVPFEAFDRAMATDDEAAREAALSEYAGALRAHVGELKKRAYWDALEQSPSFVVCFVPSDFLLSAAFEADHSLLENALQSNVLVAGPTTLMGLLWSAYLGWSQFESLENIEEIKKLAERLVDRTGVIYDHLGRLGRNLEQSTKSYNGLVGSFESSLLVTVRDIRRHGIKQARDLAPIETINDAARALDQRRWPAGASDEGVLDAELVGGWTELDPVAEPNSPEHR